MVDNEEIEALLRSKTCALEYKLYRLCKYRRRHPYSLVIKRAINVVLERIDRRRQELKRPVRYERIA